MSQPILAVSARPGPPPATVLVAEGELDHDSRDVLHGVALQCVARADVHLVLDLPAVTFCDSGGLSLFVELYRQLDAAGGTLRLAGAQGLVLGVLKTTNLDRMFTLYDSVDAAVEDTGD